MALAQIRQSGRLGAAAMILGVEYLIYVDALEARHPVTNIYHPRKTPPFDLRSVRRAVRDEPFEGASELTSLRSPGLIIEYAPIESCGEWVKNQDYPSFWDD
ncbi:hypothetical protein D3C81_1896160 [compost metagenome]